MDEKKETEDTKEEATASDNNEGNQSKEVGLVDKANIAAERLEAANKKQEEILQRQEEFAAKQLLSGRTDAGDRPVKKEPLSDKEYSDKVMKGEVNPLGV